ncbi:CRISPR-associated protein Cas5 [Nonomuraea rhizosphaerae]
MWCPRPNPVDRGRRNTYPLPTRSTICSR